MPFEMPQPTPSRSRNTAWKRVSQKNKIPRGFHGQHDQAKKIPSWLLQALLRARPTGARRRSPSQQVLLVLVPWMQHETPGRPKFPRYRESNRKNASASWRSRKRKPQRTPLPIQVPPQEPVFVATSVIAAATTKWAQHRHSCHTVIDTGSAAPIRRVIVLCTSIVRDQHSVLGFCMTSSKERIEDIAKAVPTMLERHFHLHLLQGRSK
mmetsp:Transcript_40580/g.84471  ORF Transcript_40580/g.84471 Transcript_40580/m.84471 type:complete len:209 (+) Transcript_40580:512-1138(+)